MRSCVIGSIAGIFLAIGFYNPCMGSGDLSVTEANGEFTHPPSVDGTQLPESRGAKSLASEFRRRGLRGGAWRSGWENTSL